MCTFHKHFGEQEGKYSQDVFKAQRVLILERNTPLAFLILLSHFSPSWSFCVDPHSIILCWQVCLSTHNCGTAPHNSVTVGTVPHYHATLGRFLGVCGSLSWGFPDGSHGKESACNVGTLGSIPGLGRCPGEGNGNSPQYSCLDNSTDRGYSPWGLKESDKTEWLTLSLFFLCP